MANLNKECGGALSLGTGSIETVSCCICMEFQYSCILEDFSVSLST